MSFFLVRNVRQALRKAYSRSKDVKQSKRSPSSHFPALLSVYLMEPSRVSGEKDHVLYLRNKLTSQAQRPECLVKNTPCGSQVEANQLKKVNTSHHVAATFVPDLFHKGFGGCPNLTSGRLEV